MIQYIKRAAVVLASIAAGYVYLGVPEAHSSPSAAQQDATSAARQDQVSQAPEELSDKACTSASCADICSPGTCVSFTVNPNRGCTIVCKAPVEKSKE
jgi:hypothetical protein